MSSDDLDPDAVSPTIASCVTCGCVLASDNTEEISRLTQALYLACDCNITQRRATMVFVKVGKVRVWNKKDGTIKASIAKPKPKKKK